MKIETIDITDIKPYWRNARNNEAAVKPVMDSIEKYGFRNPLLVDGEHVIIAGHTRYKALMRLGVKEVPCVVWSDAPPEKVKEYRIADNKTSEFASWNYENLIPEIREFKDIDGYIESFFPRGEIDHLVKDLTQKIDADGTIKRLMKDPQALSARPAVTQSDINAVEEGMAGTMAGRVDAQYDDSISMICPECGHGYFIKFEEVEREMQMKKNGTYFGLNSRPGAAKE